MLYRSERLAEANDPTGDLLAYVHSMQAAADACDAATLDALGDFQVDRKQAFLESLAPDDPRREAAEQDLARAVALSAARHQLVAQRTQAERDYRRDVLAATAHCTTADDYRSAAGKVQLAQQELAGRRGELAAAWNFSLATGENRMADDCGWHAAETANRFFEGDTLVKMADGSWRKISELRVGDRVLAVPHGSVNEAATACEVTAIESGAAPAWRLTFVNSSGETLQFTASEGHPFYVDGRGWVDVKELKVGDIIVTQNGSTFTLSSKTLVEQVVTWSLTVAENHTFFVGDGMGNEVVVHNTGKGGSKSVSTMSSKDIEAEILKVKANAKNLHALVVFSHSQGLQGHLWIGAVKFDAAGNITSAYKGYGPATPAATTGAVTDHTNVNFEVARVYVVSADDYKKAVAAMSSVNYGGSYDKANKNCATWANEVLKTSAVCITEYGSDHIQTKISDKSWISGQPDINPLVIQMQYVQKPDSSKEWTVIAPGARGRLEELIKKYSLENYVRLPSEK